MNREEKERRRMLRDELEVEERAKFEASLPASKAGNALVSERLATQDSPNRSQSECCAIALLLTCSNRAPTSVSSRRCSGTPRSAPRERYTHISTGTVRATHGPLDDLALPPGADTTDAPPSWAGDH